MNLQFTDANAQITKFEFTMHPDFFDNPTVHLEFQTNGVTIRAFIVLCDIDSDDNLRDLVYTHTENRDFLIKLMTILDVRSIDKIKGSYCRITTNEYGRLLGVRHIVFDDDKFEVYD